ncbi:hypothetical protein C0995_000909 [Termitomyces sp. Mi166|nr:hypothetical protein C0995_000909 [Termitomyces sp. Mi166\
MLGRRSSSPRRSADVAMDIDQSSSFDKPNARVIIVTNLTRNVAESHLQTIFSLYGPITKIDLPVYGKSGQNRGKAALEFADPPSAHKAFTHMDGGQLDGATLKLELSTLPVRSRSPTPPPQRPRPPHTADAETPPLPAIASVTVPTPAVVPLHVPHIAVASHPAAHARGLRPVVQVVRSAQGAGPLATRAVGTAAVASRDLAAILSRSPKAL